MAPKQSVDICCTVVRCGTVSIAGSATAVSSARYRYVSSVAVQSPHLKFCRNISSPATLCVPRHTSPHTAGRELRAVSAAASTLAGTDFLTSTPWPACPTTLNAVFSMLLHSLRGSSRGFLELKNSIFKPEGHRSSGGLSFNIAQLCTTYCALEATGPRAADSRLGGIAAASSFRLGLAVVGERSTACAVIEEDWLDRT